jgi:hypothetical protein
MDWYKNKVKYHDNHIEWLMQEGEILLYEAAARMEGEAYSNDISYFTLETTLCCYKSWHRPNRRYPNVYNDMMRDRIVNTERLNKRKLPVFWAARQKYLPKHLRCEDMAADMGLHKTKQNHYRLTGEVIMMHKEWPCFNNNLNDYITQRS